MAASNSVPEMPDPLALGIRFIQVFPLPIKISRLIFYRVHIFLLTYLTYTAFQITRRPLSVVKTVLTQNCSQLDGIDRLDLQNDPNWCSWPPFIGRESTNLFAWLDFTFRLSYAVGMVFAGHLGERMDLRLFLSAIMVLSGLWVIFGGLAYFWDVHSFSFFILAQALAGVFQGMKIRAINFFLA